MPADSDPRNAGVVWASYGLTGDPFFITFLEPRLNVPFGMHLFRGSGRQEDAEKIVRRILSTANSAKLIEGAIGHGKTTLANLVKSKLLDSEETAVFLDSIQVNISSPDPVRFAAEMMFGTLSAFQANERLAEATKDIENEAKGRILDDIFSRRARSISLSKIVGVTWSRSWMLRKAQEHPLGDWKDGLRKMREVAAAHGVERIVMQINNLDDSTLTDPAGLGELFGEIRDFLALPGFHFLLCASPSFRLKALDKRQGVRDLIEPPTVLSPLTKSEVEAIITARYEDLRMAGRKLTPPIQAAEFSRLVDLFDGELRFALQALAKTFTEEIAPSRFPVTLTADQVVEIQRPILEAKLAELTEPQFRVLKALAHVTGGGRLTIRQLELVAYLRRVGGKGGGQGQVSQIADELADARWIVKRQENRRRTFYSLGGTAKVVLPSIRAG